MYSQNNEDSLILDYWKSKYGDDKGTLIDIGANDGKTLSNSLLFIEDGWNAHLFEPNKNVFEKLNSLHEFNANVFCWNFGIADFDGEKEFYESGSLISADDYSLVSTLHEGEMKRWGQSVQFTKTKVNFKQWGTWYQDISAKKQNTFDYISIDAEGEDWMILNQIDLRKHDCKILCIEWNGVISNEKLFTEYANSHNLIEIHRNAENIIFAK